MNPNQYGPDGIRKEQTGWRDAAISLRHREWGHNCPAADIDFLVTEYNMGIPCGLVEYKHSTTQFPNLKHPTYRALSILAARSAIPFWLAFYWPETWAMRVFPIDDLAKKLFGENEMLTERAYVQRLYRLRRIYLAKAIEATLHNELPPILHVAASA